MTRFVAHETEHPLALRPLEMVLTGKLINLIRQQMDLQQSKIEELSLFLLDFKESRPPLR